MRYSLIPSQLHPERNNRKLLRCSLVRGKPSASQVLIFLRTQVRFVEDVAAKPALRRPKAKKAERDFILNILSATTTKREAKSYISKFKVADRPSIRPITGEAIDSAHSTHQSGNLDRLGINLGSLYTSTRAAEETPRFSQHVSDDESFVPATDTLHVALVKIRVPQLLNDTILNGIGSTLSQLAKLGMTSVIVVDCDENLDKIALSPARLRSQSLEQADRIVSAINGHNGPRGRRVADAVGISKLHQAPHSSVQLHGHVQIQYPDLLSMTLQRGTLPVIPALAYTLDTQKATNVRANDILLALVRNFTGIAAETITSSSNESKISLEKVIILDPLGGTPSLDSSRGSHVFINLEQEFHDLSQELKGKLQHDRHTENLRLVRDALALLPPTSSALITTSEEAARSASVQSISGDALGVSTRLVKNPLIHNLLTDKPTFSSSLPAARMGIDASGPSKTNPRLGPTTFIKRGMPISIIPDPREHPWTPPTSSGTTLDLQSPQIAFPRLVHLIEDSFARPLNVRHYLSRIKDHIAGVIIAGEYEGGAILTWEAPSSSPSSGPTRSLVPYLDKFAVLQRSQGSGASVADIVFKAMVRDCFPAGVVWRSRKNNPVNKWYFERSLGTWKIPGTNWCMFWTTPGIFEREGDRRWEDYVDVCRNVKASWADDKAAD
ncbi:MAG: Amino-acid acetyltransferase, mitochondrial [Bathelium mastoideum]|nr:MAG: Amino-acid acetyltransferase, mitochondrial [Bathelium mastoideum]